jgi:membrane protease YdiL (CAAX protease family)
MAEWVQEIGQVLFAGGLTAVGVLLAGLSAWRLAQSRAVPLVPPARVWRVPWKGQHLLVLTVLFLVFPFLPSMLGISEWEAPVVAFPFQMLLLAWLYQWFRSQTEGSTFQPFSRIWPARLALAAAVWTLLTPLVLGLNGLIDWSYRQLGGEPQEHPFTQVDTRSAYYAVLLVLHACVVAPWIEEFLVRGLLLPWLLATRWKGQRQKSEETFPPLTSRQRCWLMVLIGLWPALQSSRVEEALIFLGLLAGGLGVIQLGPIRHRRHWSAIYASALVFAMFHSAVWPSPIPLFVLGLGLGWVAVWTRGFFCSALLHAFFNAVSTIYVLIFGPDLPEG